MKYRLKDLILERKEIDEYNETKTFRLEIDGDICTITRDKEKVTVDFSELEKAIKEGNYRFTGLRSLKTLVSKMKKDLTEYLKTNDLTDKLDYTDAYEIPSYQECGLWSPEVTNIKLHYKAKVKRY